MCAILCLKIINIEISHIFVNLFQQFFYISSLLYDVATLDVE